MLVQELFEARQKGVIYTEKSVKGKVVKIIATLEGSKSGRYTKLAGRYKEIDEELQRLQEERDKLNEQVKGDLVDLFDAADAVYTRVVETVSLTATLNKQSEDSTKTDDTKVVERLLEDATPELKAQIEKLRKLFEKTVKAKSPALSVDYPGNPKKKRGDQVDEGVVSITLAALKGMLARKLIEFRSWATKYDKKLEKIRMALRPIPVAKSLDEGKKSPKDKLKTRLAEVEDQLTRKNVVVYSLSQDEVEAMEKRGWILRSMPNNRYRIQLPKK